MYRFNTKKVAQAAAVLLKLTPAQKMPYIKLLKLLYVTDHESLRETMRLVVGGKHVAMKKGPLHSEVYDLIQGDHEGDPVWDQFIKVDGYDIMLSSDPGDSELSDYEVELLTRVAKDYKDIDEWDTVRITHSFPEWKKTYPDPDENTSRPIHLRDMLDAVGHGDQKKEILAEIQEELREDLTFRKLLACD